jgi:hypothetical protein
MRHFHVISVLQNQLNVIMCLMWHLPHIMSHVTLLCFYNFPQISRKFSLFTQVSHPIAVTFSISLSLSHSFHATLKLKLIYLTFFIFFYCGNENDY